MKAYNFFLALKFELNFEVINFNLKIVKQKIRRKEKQH